jgi:hypothetical protein
MRLRLSGLTSFFALQDVSIRRRVPNKALVLFLRIAAEGVTGLPVTAGNHKLVGRDHFDRCSIEIPLS